MIRRKRSLDMKTFLQVGHGDFQHGRTWGYFNLIDIKNGTRVFKSLNFREEIDGKVRFHPLPNRILYII